MNLTAIEQAPERSVLFRLLRSLEREGVVRPDDSFLVVFGGEYDVRILDALGHFNYVLTNIESDELEAARETAILDACTRFGYEDGSFDHVLAHAGLHHASRPHTAVCEMYRVARRSAIFVEPQDSLTMRFAARLGFAAHYELNENTLAGGPGGVDGTSIPNHVYRWTPREVEKLVRSLDASRDAQILFFREWNLLEHARRAILATPLKGLPKPIRDGLARVAVGAVNAVLGAQGNSLGVCIRKDQPQLKPWLRDDDGQVTVSEEFAERASQKTVRARG